MWGLRKWLVQQMGANNLKCRLFLTTSYKVLRWLSFFLFFFVLRTRLICVSVKLDKSASKPHWQILMVAPPLFLFNSCCPHFALYWPPIRGEDTLESLTHPVSLLSSLHYFTGTKVSTRAATECKSCQRRKTKNQNKQQRTIWKFY